MDRSQTSNREPMSNKQTTAVQWLIEQIESENCKTAEDSKRIFKEAEEMFSQQIELATQIGYQKGYNDATSEACKEISKNYRPNETFTQ